MDYSYVDYFVKQATASMDKEACKLLSLYLAFVRALYILHQQNHWLAVQYGDHLLFQRLYEETQEAVDEAAEKTLGLCNTIILNCQEFDIVKKFFVKAVSRKSLMESSLKAEEAFIEFANKLTEHLKNKDQMTLGLEDMIPSHVNMSESHIYLLQQSLKGTMSRD